MVFIDILGEVRWCGSPVKSKGSEGILPHLNRSLDHRPYYLFDLWHLAFLCFSFPIRELGIITGLILWVVMRIKRAHAWKILRMVPTQTRLRVFCLFCPTADIINIKDTHS